MLVKVSSEKPVEPKSLSLTRLQKLYWVGQSLRPNAPIFNTVQLFFIDGLVDESRFQAAFQKLGEATDSLRITFHENGSQVEQLCRPSFDSPLKIIDLTQTEQSWQAWVDEHAPLPIDLARCSFHTALLKVHSDQYLWYFNQHHILLDAHSATLLFDRLATFYIASPGQTAVFPSFSDHLQREAAYLTSKNYEKAAAFWRKQLETPPQPTRFFGHQPVRTETTVVRTTISIPSAKVDQIRALAQSKSIYTLSEEFSLTALFATLFFIQLHGVSGNERLGVVMPMHNRMTQAAQDTAGLLMEMCPLTLAVTNEDTFLALLKQLKQRLFKMTPHVAYGASIALPQSTFDIMFNYHPVIPHTLDGMSVYHETIHPGHGSDSFALHIHDYGAGKPMLLKFDFHQDVFSADEQAELIATFEKLIAWMLEGATGTIGELKSAVFPTVAYIEPAANGKVPATLPHQPTAPTTPLETSLVDIWQRILDRPTVGIHDNFFALGGSSWLAVRLFDEIQAKIGTKLPVSTLLKAETIAQLADLLTNDPQQAAWSSLVPVRTTGAKPPFFCVHGVTGDILWLKELASLLHHEQPFFGLQARGLNGEDDPFDSMTPLAAHYVHEIRRIQPEGPYYLGGYCFGSHVAYEMACQLIEAGEQVSILVAIDPPPEGGKTDTVINGRFLLKTALNAPLWAREIARLGSEEIIARAKRKGRLALEKVWHKVTRRSSGEADASAGDIIDRVDELEAYRHQIIEAHLHALKFHRPTGYSGKTIVFDARSRPLLDPSFPSVNWQQYVGPALKIEVVPGSHATMLQSPNVQILADRLQQHLDTA